MIFFLFLAREMVLHIDNRERPGAWLRRVSNETELP